MNIAGMRLERGEHREHVGELDLESVIVRIAVVVGEPAAAIVERDHAARVRGPRAQAPWRARRNRLPCAPGRAGRPPAAARCAPAIAARMQLQAVGRGDEELVGPFCMALL